MFSTVWGSQSTLSLGIIRLLPDSGGTQVIQSSDYPYLEKERVYGRTKSSNL